MASITYDIKNTLNFPQSTNLFSIALCIAWIYVHTLIMELWFTRVRSLSRNSILKSWQLWHCKCINQYYHCTLYTWQTCKALRFLEETLHDLCFNSSFQIWLYSSLTPFLLPPFLSLLLQTVFEHIVTKCCLSLLSTHHYYCTCKCVFLTQIMYAFLYLLI